MAILLVTDREFWGRTEIGDRQRKSVGHKDIYSVTKAVPRAGRAMAGVI